jgi:S-methylmethionine-dependent homocysteine/selenocysteine methylase
LTEALAITDILTEIGSTIPFWVTFSCRNEFEISSGEIFADVVRAV